MLRTDIVRYFDVTLPFATPQVILRESTDASPVVGGRYTAQSTQVQGQAVPPRQDGAEVCILLSQQYGFWTASIGVEDFFGNHDSALFLHHGARK